MSDKEKKYKKMEEIYKQIIAYSDLNGFTNSELAYVLTIVMMKILKKEENRQGLKKVGIYIDDKKSVDIDFICLIQSMWAKQYHIQNSGFIAGKAMNRVMVNIADEKNKGDN